MNPRRELLPAQVDAKDAPIVLHACTLAWEGDMMRIHDAYWSMHNHSALFCEVRVNIVTGEIRVSRFLGSFNCGRILYAKTAASRQPRLGWVSLKLGKAWIFVHQSAKPGTLKSASLSGVSET